MAEAETKEEEKAEEVISQIGKQLASSKTCPNKSTLVKLLKQAAGAFSEMKQSGVQQASFLELKQSESLKLSVKPMGDSLIKHGLLDHKDRDIRLLVGICLCEIIRVLAPNPDFSLAVFRDIFKFLLSIFEELGDIDSPYFLKRAKLLDTVAKLQFCLVMLDTGCEDLVLKMFKIFFNVVREDHPRSLINSMSSIITSILEDNHDPLESNICHSLIDVILQNIMKERKSIGSASHHLALTVMQNCGEKLERSLCQFLKSCILERDAVKSVIKESYHEIILEIYRISPRLLLSAIPSLTHELMTDQVDVRIKAVNLIKKLLLLHGQQFARDYPDVYCELLNRFSDKSAEVRLITLSCAKYLHRTNQSGKDSSKILSAIQGRLLDHDDKVRMEAVNVICELAKTNLNLLTGLIIEAAKRLRDKKVFVRSKALQKLVELYQEYCTRCAEDVTLLNEHIEEIPCKLLMLCYEKDCHEFRTQRMEFVLADLFPTSLSIEERTRHWIIIFSLFKPPHLKALKIILSQKRRLRDGLKDFLDLWNEVQDNGSEQARKRLETLVMKMSSCFPDPAEANDCFQKLKALENNEVFIMLQKFLASQMTQITLNTETIKDACERELGDHKALPEFLHLVYKKCSFNIFSSEHVQYILDCLSSDETEKKHLKDCQVQLLLTIISAFPSLLRDSEQQFQLLLRVKEIPFNEQVLEMLATEGCHMYIKLSDVYSSLEEVCLEGSRAQAKLAVFAIAALAGTEQSVFPKLCKTLVDSLCIGKNAPTVLQSLGCLAQHSLPSLEDLETVMTHYIVEKIFQSNDALTFKDLEYSDEDSNCCSSCKLKIFGLKALVRSYLPHKHACLTRPISFLLDVIQQVLQKRGFSAGSIPCVRDEAFICIAATNSVLRLSRKWDLHISPQIFRLTISMAKDHSPWVRRSCINKVHKLLNNYAVPSRYACAFSFVALDCIEHLRNDGLKYLEEFIREYGKRAQLHETTTIQESANHPAYMVVFLIHVIVHDPNFPSPDCRDENIYAEFLSPLFLTVESIVNEMTFDGNSDHKSNAALYLRSIFIAIKKAGDAIDAHMTQKLHFVAAAGVSILDSLNISATSAPYTPGLVLLPSSLYTSYPEMIEVNAYPLIGCNADAIFTKKLVSRLKFEVLGTGTKHDQQSDETSLRVSNGRSRALTSKSSNKSNLAMNNTKEQHVELHTGQKELLDIGGQENPVKSLHAKSVKDKSSDETKHVLGLDGNPTLFENEIIGSCSRGKSTVNKCDSSCVGPSKLSRENNNVICATSNEIGTQIVKSQGETLVGKRIKLWSPIERCYFSGVVHGFDSTNSTHQISYKSGESDIRSLDGETWEIDTDDLQAQYCGNTSANSRAQPMDSKQEKFPKKRDNCIKKISQPVKRAKRNDAALSPLISKVTGMNGNNRIRRSGRLNKV